MMEGVSQQKRSFTIDSAILFAAKTYLKNFWFLLLVHMAVGAIPSLIASCLWRSEPVHQVLQTLIQMLYIGGFLAILLTLVDGKKPRFSNLFSRYRLFWFFLGAYICAWALWGVGLIAFIVPGVVAMLHTCFYGLVIAEDECGPIDAFRRSSQLTKGSRWKLLGFFCVLLALSLPIAFIAGLLLAIPAVLLHVFFHVGVKVLLTGGLLMCYPPVLIFWELAWVHCYRQLTMNTAHSFGSLEYAKAKLEAAHERYAVAENNLDLATSKLLKVLSNVSALKGSLTDSDTDSLLSIMTSFGRMGQKVTWTGAEMREMELIGLPIAKLEAVGAEVKAEIEKFLAERVASEDYEQWIPRTINTGTIDWTVENVDAIASNVSVVAIRLESLPKKVDLLAEKLSAILNSEKWFPASWSDSKLKSIYLKTDKKTNATVPLAAEIMQIINQVSMGKLLLGTLPNQIKWDSMTDEERDQLELLPDVKEKRKISGPPEVQEAIKVLDEIEAVRPWETAFKPVRQFIENYLARNPEEFIAKLETTPLRELIITFVMNTAADFVETGEHHIYRGVVNPLGPGEDLVCIFNWSQDELLRIGATDAETVRSSKEAFQRNLQTVG